MKYQFSWSAFAVFAVFVSAVLLLSFYLGRKAKSAKGYYAAHGQINWFVNGVAFAGDYLSAASFLGICGLIAFFGYDGFLYSIGFLAGWVVALLVIAEPLKRLGKFTFADALDAKFDSRGIKLSAAVSTLLVSIFYLIPQMVGAGALIEPLLGLPYYWLGVVLVGLVVILIVVTAGMVSTTWVQFIKGSLLVFFCLILTVMILRRGLATPRAMTPDQHRFAVRAWVPIDPQTIIPPTGVWAGPVGSNYLRVREPDGRMTLWRIETSPPDQPAMAHMRFVSEVQWQTNRPGEAKLVNGRPWGLDRGRGEADFWPVGHVAALPGGAESTGPLGPFEFLSTFQDSTIVTWGSDRIEEADGTETMIYFPKVSSGASLLQPGAYFKGVRSPKITDRLDFISLMLALFCGTASLPHILIRYYTVKDGNAARKSTVVGIASIGFFYVLTLFLGLGAMVSGGLDPTNSNMAAPLLAKTFGAMPFAIISAIAFTTVLGTVSGLIMAASGAVAHDLMANYLKIEMTDHQQVRAGKATAIVVGVIAMALGVAFKNLNVGFLVGWAFNVAASANLPALVMLLFWKKTTTASIIVGLLSSLGWLLLSGPAYKDVYGLNPAAAPAPFSQPGLVTIPLGFIVLVVVSLLTQPRSTNGFDTTPGPIQAR